MTLSPSHRWEMGTTGCVIAEMARPSAVAAHQQGEGCDDPSEDFQGSTIHGASAGKYPVIFHNHRPQNPYSKVQVYILVGGCNRVENYSLCSVGARNTRRNMHRVHGAPETAILSARRASR